MKFVITKYYYFALLILCCSPQLRSLTVGSDSAVSRQGATNFTGVGNEMNGFGAFEGGFSFADAATTCSFDSFFPVSGSVNMKAGSLYLLKDLLFDKGTSLVSMGDVFGAGHLLEYSASVTALWAPLAVTMKNVVLAANTDISWQLQTTFQGTCTIDGHGKKVTLESAATMAVASGAKLTFRNMELNGLQASNLSCQDITSSIVFENCEVHLTSDFTFANGSIWFERDVELTGTNQFTYSSVMGSTIGEQSSLMIGHNMTWYYAPAVANRDLLYMVDKSSSLHLDGCTLKSTATGIRLTRGWLFCGNDVTFSCAGTLPSESICFGNGIAANNLNVTFLSGLDLDASGGWHYDNV